MSKANTVTDGLRTGVLRECDVCDRIIEPFEDILLLPFAYPMVICTNCVDEHMQPGKPNEEADRE